MFAFKIIGFPLFALLLCSGCGDDETAQAHNDCRDPALACYAPSTCQADGAEYVCAFPSSQPPTCHGTPQDQHVPFTLTQGDIPEHWPIDGGCIAVSYEAALAPRAADIVAAAQAWASISCSQLCFGQPQQLEPAPDIDRAERRIHFMVDDSFASEFPQYEALTTTAFDLQGRLRGVEIKLRTSAISTYHAAGLIRLFGFALGLATAPPPLGEMPRSVMEPYKNPPEITAPTAEDQQAICTLYGSPSYCGE